MDELIRGGGGPSRPIPITAFHLGRCAARVDTGLHGDREEPFAWRPRMLAPELAAEILAVRRARPPLAAVEEAIAAVISGNSAVGREIAELTPGARTLVVRLALETVGAVVQHGAMNPETRFGVRSHQWGAGPFSLQAKSFIRRPGPTGAPNGTIGLLSVNDDPRVSLGHLALVVTLAERTGPEVVAGFATASGGWQRCIVDESFLDAALARVLDRIGEMAGARAGVAPTREPGGWCTWCALEADCAVRLDAATRGEIRSGGVPVDMSLGL
ncbi:MAG: hypothetical protein AB7V43_08040 [Acidimicrobiia bacterium]